MAAGRGPPRTATSADRLALLRVAEIFHSLQGESTRVGLPTVFIRLTGCPLRCVWCDSEYAFTGGSRMDIDQVLRQVAHYQCRHVCVTGGEPLAQTACLSLLACLCDAGYSVSLETSGAIDIAPVDPRVVRIMDLKAPGSGEVERNLWSNLAELRTQDEIKFVLAGEEDYLWARDLLSEYDLAAVCTVLFAPVQGRLDPVDLAAWILRDRLPVRFQLQLHKILWGAERGR